MSQIDLCVALSDLHFGKRTATYSTLVGERRIAELPDKLAAAHNVSPSVVWILLAGDLVDGECIYDYHSTQVDAVGIEQVERCATSIAGLVISVGKAWPRATVRVRGVRGNHGRLNKAAAPETNLDSFVLSAIGERLRKRSRTEVVVDSSLVADVDTAGGRVLLIHKAERNAAGNATRFRVLRRLRAHRADLLVAGHWHSPEVYSVDGRPLYVANGSLCGPDEYSEQLGLYDPPAQCSWTSSAIDGFANFSWSRW